MTTHTRDLAIARAERDAWQTTCEELHHQIARLTVEAETYRRDIDAERACRRTLDAALSHEREASRGLVAQVEHWRSVGDAAIDRALAAESARDMAEAARDAHADELRAIRDLAAPGNPQGTVADAVRARLDAVENAQAFVMRERDDARRAQAETTTAPPAARPVFAGVSEDELIRLFYVVGTDGIDHGEQCPPIDISDRNGIRAVLARLEVSLVAPEFLRRIPLYTKHGPGGKGDPGICDAACVKCEAERMFLGAPAREVAPTLVAVSDEELVAAYYGINAMPLDEDERAGIRAVRAKLGAAEVTEERLAAALCEHFKYEGHRDWSADARAILAHLRATAAKGG